MQMQNFEKHVWAEIDLDALRHNFRAVKARAGELPLCGKGVVQPLKHLIEGLTELLKLRQGILIDPHIRQIVHLHSLHLRSKAVQGLECVSADKVGKNAAQYRNRSRDVPVGGAKSSLHTIDNDGQFLAGFCELRVEARRAFISYNNSTAAPQRVRNPVHIVHAGGAEHQIHGDTGQTDEQGSHQGDAPL